jgi:hypothetical protein
MSEIAFPRGDTHVRDLTVAQSDGDPFDLTGALLVFTVKRNTADEDPGVLQHRSDGATPGIEITDAEAGLAVHTVPAADSDALVPGYRYAYDYQLTAFDGSVRTLEAGVLTVTADVTREIV